MSFIVADRVHETTLGTGTGNMALGGAADNCQTFSSVCVDGDTLPYGIIGQSGNQFETGIGTYQAAGDLIVRTTVIESSNANALVSFSAGTKDIFIAVLSSQVQLVGGNSLTPIVTLSSGSALTVNWATGVNQMIVLTANCTFTFSAPRPGSILAVTLAQDATGSRTVTWPPSVKWGTGNSPPTLSTAPTREDLIRFYYDGTNYASLGVLLGYN